MKWFFVILLVINIFYLGLELRKDQRSALYNIRYMLPVPLNVKRLQLLSEIEQSLYERSITKISTDNHFVNANSNLSDVSNTLLDNTHIELDLTFYIQSNTELTEVLATVDKKDVADQKISCYRYGPITNTKEAVALDAWFQERQVSSVLSEKKSKTLYWVYLTALDDPDEVDKTIYDLKKKGIQNLKHIEKGAMHDAISLGLFSNQTQVNQRLNEIKQMGYQAMVVPYYDNQEFYWLDVKIHSQSPVITGMLSGLPAKFKITHKICDPSN